jgi:hypothetical protein
LGRFDKTTLKNINWTRGIFRFNQIDFCEDGKLYDGEKYYYTDLTPLRTTKYTNLPNIIKRKDMYTNIKYGFVVKNKKNNQEGYLRLLSDCEFMLDLGTIKFIIDRETKS